MDRAERGDNNRPFCVVHDTMCFVLFDKGIGAYTDEEVDIWE
jgi:hypothetical protein